MRGDAHLALIQYLPKYRASRGSAAGFVNLIVTTYFRRRVSREKREIAGRMRMALTAGGTLSDTQAAWLERQQ